MRPPCASGEAVFGYGDVNGDFHVIGDHPGCHGGRESGVPFTETDSGRAIDDLLRAREFRRGRADEPEMDNCFCSYIHQCTPRTDADPTPAGYDRLERFFDAELRAINAHILIPVGERPTRHVISTYTTHGHRWGGDMAASHAREYRGRGFLVVPIRDPSEWESGDRERIERRLRAIEASDYRQTKGVATLVG